MSRPVTFHWPAGEHERFAPGAFDGMVGKQVTMPVTGGGRMVGEAIAVSVDPDGAGVDVTVDLPESVSRAISSSCEGFSLGGR
jgi:hypothetical protein